jgi:hypothetical protein
MADHKALTGMRDVGIAGYRERRAVAICAEGPAPLAFSRAGLLLESVDWPSIPLTSEILT